MIWLLANWRWALPSAGAAILGIWLGITKLELVSERAARAEERTAAAKFALDAETAARQKDNDNAQLARDLDATRLKADADTEAGRADFDSRLAGVLRSRRQACSNGVPAPAPDPSTTAGTTAGSDGGRGTLDSGNSLRKIVKDLQADVAECVAWAPKVGR